MPISAPRLQCMHAHMHARRLCHNEPITEAHTRMRGYCPPRWRLRKVYCALAPDRVASLTRPIRRTKRLQRECVRTYVWTAFPGAQYASANQAWAGTIQRSRVETRRAYVIDLADARAGGSTHLSRITPTPQPYSHLLIYLLPALVLSSQSSRAPRPTRAQRQPTRLASPANHSAHTVYT